MTTKKALAPEAAAYLSALRAELADLSPEEREDLLEEVAGSLSEALKEGGSIVGRLGAPEAFAAELRQAAGLPPARINPRPKSWAAALDRARVLSSAVAPDLAPIWWLVRAYVAVGALALAFSTSWSTTNGAIPRLPTGHIGLVVLVVAAALSVALGMLGRRRTAPRGVVLALNLVFALALVPVAVHLVRHPGGRAPIYVSPSTVPTSGLLLNGAPVTNIYAFSRDGRMLHDVLLYGGDGRPLSIRPGVPDPNRRLLYTVSGRPLFNSFPIRFYEPGTRTVLHPDAAPRIFVPKVAPKAGSAGSKSALVAVPVVIGVMQQLAVRKIEAAGLRVVISHQRSAGAAGVVTAQYPSPGTLAPSGATVDIHVSAG
ncbi:MAG: PASTA domain-containing protein [Gaiellaceae bacterium]|jgi:uncharacterized membrane protein